MISDNFQPLQLATEVQNAADQIVAGAQRSADGKILVVQVVNFADQDTSVKLDLHEFVPGKSTAKVEELAAPLDAQNPASAPKRVTPVVSDWRHQFQAGKVARMFPAHSFTVIRFQ
jgi:alpha-L-arabinofuranosidase